MAYDLIVAEAGLDIAVMHAVADAVHEGIVAACRAV